MASTDVPHSAAMLLSESPGWTVYEVEQSAPANTVPVVANDAANMATTRID
jgi:hypothetical protein